MKCIWKYRLKPGYTYIDMPCEAQVLTAAAQGGTAQLWALVDPDNMEMNRTFLTVATGEAIDTERTLTYIGTINWNTLIFHTFEVTG